MSSLTKCNRCNLNDMKARARKRNVDVTVVVITDPGDAMRGWTSARYSDEDKPSAWFQVLTEACAC